MEPTAGALVTPNVRLVKPLGAGGMGSVWVADHLALRTQVVVKFMATDLAEAPEAKARFSREAAAASQVKSPHVVQTLDHGVHDELGPYIVMELLEGEDLAATLAERGKLPAAEVVAIVAQLARALYKAHAAGIVHRDVKPNNIFLCDAGGGELFVKLLDFGIAKSDLPKNAALVGSTTRTGSFVGSPFYMSPEQVVGAKAIDHRSDLWSLGVVAYEALTGEKPFFAETVGGLALKIHRDPLPVPSSVNPALPVSVDAWFAKACAREPDGRFASAKELADALALAVTGERLTPRLAIESSPQADLPFAPTARVASYKPPADAKVDTKQETHGGVQLATHRPKASAGKLAVAGLIAGVAVVIGFTLPRAFRTESPSAAAIAPIATTSAPAPEPALVPAPAPEPALATEPAPAPTPSTVAHAKHFTPPAPIKPLPLPSASAAAKPPPSRPQGSDDDIK